MSIRNLDKNTLFYKELENVDPLLTSYRGLAQPEWTRNPSWPALPSLTVSDQKVVALHAVFPADGTSASANYASLSFAGNYTIDWGDGTGSTNFASGTQIYKVYDYTAAALAGTDGPVTFTDAGDTVNRTAHGYTNGMIVRFYNIVTTTGITEDSIYYVINATANSFQISLTPGGSAVALTNNGSGTLLPYKIATVTVTPQAGQNLTSVNFSVKHNQSNLNTHTTGWLDIAVAGSNITSLLVSNVGNTRHAMLEQFDLVKSGTISGNLLFYVCYRLANVKNFNATNVTNCSDMFNQAQALVNVPFFNTTGCTNFNFMFNSCNNLRQVPQFDTSSATSMVYMFNGCTSLVDVPLMKTGLVSNTQNMFSSCYLLKSIPALDLKSSINTSAMFNACMSLEKLPWIDIKASSNCSTMFQNCVNLLYLPPLDTANCTNMNNMFFSCYALREIPTLNTGNTTNLAGTFTNCLNLLKLPTLNLAACTNTASMFNSCWALQTVDLINTGSVVNAASMFVNCFNLQSVPLIQANSINNMTAMFSSCSKLANVSISNSAAVTTTANMFAGCGVMQYVPLFNTALVSNTANMFNNCFSLVKVPLFNLSNSVNVTNMFTSCVSLANIPAFNVSNVSSSANFTNFINNCPSLARVEASQFKFTFSVASAKLSNTALQEIFTNLPTVSGQTITISTNPGTGTLTTPTTTVSASAGSKTVSLSSTTGFAVGQEVTGTGMSMTTPIAVTFTDTGDLVTLTAHGLSNGDEVSFPSITSTTGISINTIYYVVNATTNDFQVAATLGGAALPLTTNGTGTMIYSAEIESLVTNVSITLKRPATATNTTANSLTTRSGGLKTWRARARGWTITG